MPFPGGVFHQIVQAFCFLYRRDVYTTPTHYFS